MAALHPVRFSHPILKNDLTINVNPDQVTWSYGLNTASYPTYGGEVIQILSVYFGDMTIAGTVGTTGQAEAIYGWFIAYMQYATQGRDHPGYDQRPVTFTYPERNWTFQIWPKALPGFRYARDLVAPTWTLTAAVKEPDPVFAAQIKDYAAFNAAHKGEFDTFGKATADFGTTGDLVNNPWASPDADPSAKGQSLNSYLTQQIQQLADSYSGFVQSYQSGDLSSLPQFQDISKAANAIPTGATKTKK